MHSEKKKKQVIASAKMLASISRELQIFAARLRFTASADRI